MQLVIVKICPKGVQQTGVLFCTPSFPSTPHSPMWIALQSSTQIYPGVLECSTHGVALRNALAIKMMEHEVWSIVMAMKGTYGLPILQTSCSIILTAPMYNTDKSSGQEYLLLHHRHTSSFGKICCNSSSQLCYAFLAKEENCHQTS